MYLCVSVWQKHGRFVCSGGGREFESCVPDGRRSSPLDTANCLPLRAAHNRMCDVNGVCTLISCFSFPFRARHARTETTFVLCTFINAKRTGHRTNERATKKCHRLFTHSFISLFCRHSAHNGIVRWSLLRQMRAHQFNEEIYVCVRSILCRLFPL